MVLSKNKSVDEIADFTDLTEAEINYAVKQRNIEIAKKMLKRGTPIEYISEDTGLSTEEIEKLTEK